MKRKEEREGESIITEIKTDRQTERQTERETYQMSEGSLRMVLKPSVDFERDREIESEREGESINTER